MVVDGTKQMCSGKHLRQMDDRMIFILRGFGFSDREISEVLQVAPRSICYRRKHFKKLFQNDEWLTKMIEWVAPILDPRTDLVKYINESVKAGELLPRAEFSTYK